MKKNIQKTDYFRDVLQNRVLVFTALFVTILCYGFAVTHQSIGVDDVARNFYLYSDGSWNMIRQGRLLHVLLNTVTRFVAFIPFFTEFVGASLFCLSALLFCGLFQTVCEGKLPVGALAAFAAIYLSCSINVEKFLYSLDVLATTTSFCCCPMSLLYARWFVCGERRAAFPAVLLGMVTIASYESFLFLYVCGFFAILILEILKDPEKWGFLSLLKHGLGFALVLIVAVMSYYALVAAVQHLSGYVRTTSPYTAWDTSEKGFFRVFSDALLGIAEYFRQSLQVRYYPIWIFCALTGAGGLLMVWLAAKKKNFWLLLCFLALFLSNFFIHIIYGSFHPRIAQTFCFYTGFLTLLITAWCQSKRLLKTAAAVGICLLMLIQSADMNRWFFNDYVRSEKESYVVHTLATRLLDGYDLSKPVIFTNCPDHWADDSGYLVTRLYPGGDVNGNSVIYWCGNTVIGYCPTFAADLFRLYGYDFLVSPTTELARKAQTDAEGMPAWPSEGCIREFDDFIAVNFG